jgi:hypothetical protein
VLDRKSGIGFYTERSIERKTYTYGEKNAIQNEQKDYGKAGNIILKAIKYIEDLHFDKIPKK